MTQPVFRFAPSPNGYLHIGHAYSALFSQKVCRSMGGKMLLRIEDTDRSRSRVVYEEAIFEDLQWIGFEWQGTVRRQSDHLEEYQPILDQLLEYGLAYISVLSRKEIKEKITDWERRHEKPWPRDPDGAFHYPGDERNLDRIRQTALAEEYLNHAVRLDVEKAHDKVRAGLESPLNWQELKWPDGGTETIEARVRDWGDIVLGRKDIPAAYHLACVQDDAQQQVTHIVRGMDLFHATSIHRLLQELLGLSQPIYIHHELVLDDQGEKYSKSRNHQSLRELRQQGMDLKELYSLIGIG